MTRKKMMQTIEKIAKDILGIDDLQVNKSNELDFYNLAIWSIELALIQAYKAGLQATKKITNH